MTSLSAVAATAVGVLAFASILGWLVESVVEILFSPIIDAVMNGESEKTANWRKIIKTWLATVLGIGIAFAAGIDVLSAIASQFEQPFSIPVVGVILTGFIIGRGANFVHDLAARLTAKPEG